MPALLPPALELSLDLLRCPACRTRRLHPDRGSLRCSAGHALDLGRQGYVGLLTGARATSGDDAAMVRARERFLAGGGYLPIRQAVAQLAADAVCGHGTVVDSGCGTGHYLAGVLDRLPAARGLADAVLDVFAPRNPAEFRRVLRPGGRLIVVRPTGRHLAELRGRVPGMVTVDPAKERRLHRALHPFFEAAATGQVEYRTFLTGPEALNLPRMTPSARHPSPAAPDGDGVLPAQVTVSVLVTAYRPR
ncbi:putative RNA methyltransferase [Streptomyces sp. NPDC059629]|uniref:putative RNA methyltransferase n=1 Tax=Streptomyces sp. NPDC059629 TaxID=3346889 RepID=UPI00367BFCB3